MGTVLRRLQSTLDYIWFVYRSEFSWLVAFAIFALSLPLAWLPTEIIVVGVLIGTATAAAGLLRSGRSIFQRWKRARLVDIGRERRTEVDAEWHSPGSFSASVRHSGPDRTAFWWDRDVNETLRWRSIIHDPVVGRLTKGRYRLPTRLQEIAGRGLRYGKRVGRASRGDRALPIRFNGRLLRLATEPTVQTLQFGVLDFEHVTYFDGECSNELWSAREVNQEARGGNDVATSVGVVDRYACDRDGRMLALDYASTANIVGISVLAVTADNHAVLVRQSIESSIAPGAWASSGSGSLERRDLHSAGTAGQAADSALTQPFNAVGLILSGMLRELREESLLRSEEIDGASARITAYWRWAERAMKPEFSGIVRLRVTAADLVQRQHRGLERAFSREIATVRLDELLSALREHRNPMNGTLNPSCEVTLLAAADFLETAVGRTWSMTGRV